MSDTQVTQMSSVVVDTGPIPIADLHPHPDNPNRGDPEAIAQSLTTTGQYRPIVANHDGTILAGHHVWKAAQSLGWTHVDVARVNVDADTARRILIADNRIADLGTGMDDRMLLDILNTLDGDLEGTGYTQGDLDNLTALLDDTNWDSNTTTQANGHQEDHEDQEEGEQGLPEPDLSAFWPKIQLQVPPEVFDAWRALLDNHTGDNDTDKLTAYLTQAGYLAA